MTLVIEAYTSAFHDLRYHTVPEVEAQDELCALFSSTCGQSKAASDSNTETDLSMSNSLPRASEFTEANAVMLSTAMGR